MQGQSLNMGCSLKPVCLSPVCLSLSPAVLSRASYFAASPSASRGHPPPFLSTWSQSRSPQTSRKRPRPSITSRHGFSTLPPQSSARTSPAFRAEGP